MVANMNKEHIPEQILIDNDEDDEATEVEIEAKSIAPAPMTKETVAIEVEAEVGAVTQPISRALTEMPSIPPFGAQMRMPTPPQPDCVEQDCDDDQSEYVSSNDARDDNDEDAIERAELDFNVTGEQQDVVANEIKQPVQMAAYVQMFEALDPKHRGRHRLYWSDYVFLKNQIVENLNFCTCPKY